MEFSYFGLSNKPRGLELMTTTIIQLEIGWAIFIKIEITFRVGGQNRLNIEIIFWGLSYQNVMLENRFADAY